MTRRLLPVVLMLALLLTLFPTVALASDDEKLIAITYDDGPYNFTSELLDGLKENGAKVTFFMVGEFVPGREDIVRRAWEEGHQVASHTWNHPSLTGLSADGIRSQLDRTDAVLDGSIGEDFDYMLRPPYGSYNSYVLSVIQTPAFFWSMNTADYLTSSSYSVYTQIMNTARDGAICCIHDTHYSTVVGSLQAIAALQAQGYECVTLEEMFYRRGISLEPGVIYFDAYPSSGDGHTADAFSLPVISAEDRGTETYITITGDTRYDIYYTLNDVAIPAPSTAIHYTEPFAITESTTVHAVGVRDWNGLRTDTVDQYIPFTPTASAPSIAVGSDTVSMASDTPGATIYYTTDGSAPDESSTVYTQPLPLTSDITYRAFCRAEGYRDSQLSMCTITPTGNIMRDVSKRDWHYTVLDRAVNESVINGVEPEYMAPDEPITAAMIITMLYRQAQPESVNYATWFSDVTTEDYCYKPFCWAVDNGIMTIREDGSIGAWEPITREFLAAIFSHYLRTTGQQPLGVDDVLSDFTDRDQISDWCSWDVAALVQLGILHGYEDSTMRPQGSTTRAEAVAMLQRVADLPAAGESTEIADEPAETPAENTDATDESAESTDATDEPAESTDATDESTESTDATDESTESTDATDESIESTDAADESAESTDATDESAESTDATDESTESTDASDEPAENTDTPAADAPAQPPEDGTQPPEGAQPPDGSRPPQGSQPPADTDA